MTTPRHQTTKLWSAVTGHRFDRFGDLSPKQGRVGPPGERSWTPPPPLTATGRLPKARTSPRTPKPAALILTRSGPSRCLAACGFS